MTYVGFAIKLFRHCNFKNQFNQANQNEYAGLE